MRRVWAAIGLALALLAPVAHSAIFSEGGRRAVVMRKSAYIPSGFAYITGDRTSQITVTATAGLMAGTLSQLVNGSTVDTGVYFNAVTVAGKRVVFYFNGSTAYIDEATLYTILGGGAGLGTWKWVGSNDGTSWTDIGSSFALSSSPNTFPMTSMNGNLTGWKYYAMEGVSGSASAAPWVAEFRFRQGS
jgi:hypothetical protein